MATTFRVARRQEGQVREAGTATPGSPNGTQTLRTSASIALVQVDPTTGSDVPVMPGSGPGDMGGERWYPVEDLATAPQVGELVQLTVVGTLAELLAGQPVARAR